MTDWDAAIDEPIDFEPGELFVLALLGLLLGVLFSPFQLWRDGRDHARRRKSKRDEINLHNEPSIITGAQQDHG